MMMPFSTAAFPAMSAIAFPSIDPVLISIGPLAIHWYGAMYVVGILLGWYFAKKVVSNDALWGQHGSPIRTIEIDDFLTWAVIGIIVGGRLGYVLFYNLPFYLENPLDIPAVWDGGMSFHGGAFGTLVAMVLFARSRGFNPLSLIDIIAAASCFGIFFVRIANFINSELWGRITDVPWGVIFPNGGPDPRHPSQLYESFLEGALLFAVLAFLITKRHTLQHAGFTAGAWICGYGSARVFIEFFRQPDAQLGFLFGDWLTMGMVLSLPMVAVGVALMATAKKRAPWRLNDDGTLSIT